MDFRTLLWNELLKKFWLNAVLGKKLSCVRAGMMFKE